MEKKTITWWQFLCMGLLYIVLVLAASFTGYLNPTCWAYYSVPAALLAVGPYYWLSARWQKFGAGTFMALMLLLFCIATGEAKGLLPRIMMLGGGVLADVIRIWVGQDSKKGLYAAYPLLAIGNIGWVIRIWSTPDWYIQGAIDEMGQTYADGIAQLQTPGHLITVIILTAAVAAVSILLCGKVDKKSAQMLQ